MADSLSTHRRWFRFSLRTLLVTWIGVAAWLGWWIHSAEQQRDAVANIQRLTSRWMSRPASVYYSYEVVGEHGLGTGPLGPIVDSNARSWASRFARYGLGPDYFHNVVAVYVGGAKRGQALELADELARLPKLRHLEVYNLDVTDAMVERLVGLRQLASLELRGDSLSDDALRLISGLPRLQALDIGGAFTDAGLAHLTRARTMKSLQVSGPHITDQGLAHLSRLPNLQLLHVSPTHLTEQGFEKLAACTNLSYLGFWGGVTDDDLRGIAAIRSLESLDLAGSKISDVGIQHLTGLTNLRRLDLSHTPLTDDAIPFIARLSNLVRIELDGTRLTDDAIPFLARLPKLEEVVFDDTQATVSGLEQFKASPKLRSLRVHGRRYSAFTNLLIPFANPRGFSADDVSRLKRALPACTVAY